MQQDMPKQTDVLGEDCEGEISKGPGVAIVVIDNNYIRNFLPCFREVLSGL